MKLYNNSGSTVEIPDETITRHAVLKKNTLADDMKVGDRIKVFGDYMEIEKIIPKASTILLLLEDGKKYILQRNEIRDIMRVEEEINDIIFSDLLKTQKLSSNHCDLRFVTTDDDIFDYEPENVDKYHEKIINSTDHGVLHIDGIPIPLQHIQLNIKKGLEDIDFNHE